MAISMRVMGSSAASDWGTPQWLFDALDEVFHFDLDAAADLNNHKHEHFLGAMEYGFIDALETDWCQKFGWGYAKNIWINPPYGRMAARFVAKARDESRKGLVVVCLIASRTGSRWLYREIKKLSHGRGEISAYTALPGRLHFVRPDGTTGPAPFDSAIVVFSVRPISPELREALDSLGAVWPREAAA